MFSAFFSFSGRMNRAPFWAYSLLLCFVTAVVFLILMWSLLGPTIAELVDQLQQRDMPTPTEIVAMFAEDARRFGWIAVIFQVVLTYPAAALCVKRRHDRNRSGIDVLVYFGLAIAVSVLTTLGIGMQGGPMSDPEPWMQGVQLCLFIFAVYLFVVLAFLKGTIGPNKYGPDQLLG